MDNLIKLNTTVNSPCKGQIFKAQVSHCRTKRDGFLFSVRLVRQARLSCEGCDNCDWSFDCMGDVSPDWPIINIAKAEHGKLYTIGMCNISKDFETCIVDEWNLKLIPVKEDKTMDKSESTETP